jgi:predicted RNA-binding Zn-ribbon protein involved in translation (DUF1610 family)
MENPVAPESLCAICQTPLSDGGNMVACPACHAPYHAECWAENGGCAVYGCEQVPKVGMRTGMEIPASYWGRENKPCPACGAEILAAAVRCRHCGATFASAQPEDAEAFRKRSEQGQIGPGLRRQAVWIFIFCVMPLTAPIGAVVALVWWNSHREEIKALPALHAGLARLALIVGCGQTVLAVIMGVLYAAFRGGA